jgi:hypothetical protein
MLTMTLQFSVLHDVRGTSGANKNEVMTNAKFSSVWHVVHNGKGKVKRKVTPVLN